jgi:DNA-directed RNA polymerase subunit RPC12/RpoP
MPYVCLNCGETTEFQHEIEGTATVTGVQYVDCDGEEEDFSWNDQFDETITQKDDIECSNCGSQNVKNVSQEDWDMIDDGEIDIDEYNPAIVAKSWKEKFKK